MILLRSGSSFPSDRFFIIFQDAGGILLPPIFEEAHINGDQISIEVHFPQSEALTFIGTITPQAIDGGFKNRDWRFVLPRRDRAVNRFADCT